MGRVRYLLDCGNDVFEYKSEEDILNHIKCVREMLIDKMYNNKIYALEKIKIEKRKGKKYKIYMLVNQDYSSKEKLVSAIKEYKNNGFNAYPLL